MIKSPVTKEITFNSIKKAMVTTDLKNVKAVKEYLYNNFKDIKTHKTTCGCLRTIYNFYNSKNMIVAFYIVKEKALYIYQK